jgi:hypothetical protein
MRSNGFVSGFDITSGKIRNAMNYRNLFAAAAVVFMVAGMAACSNQDGAGDTVDGTSEDAYELQNNEDLLAPPMDSVKAVATDTAAPAAATADSTTAK